MQVAVHLVHAAVEATFLDVQLVAHIVEALLALLTLPNFLEGLLIDVAIFKSFVQKIGATTVDGTIGHDVAPDKGCSLALAIAFALLVLAHAVLAEHHVEVLSIESLQVARHLQVRLVIEVFVLVGLAEHVLGIRLDHQIVEADLVTRQQGQLLHFLRILGQE